LVRRSFRMPVSHRKSHRELKGRPKNGRKKIGGIQSQGKGPRGIKQSMNLKKQTEGGERGGTF